MQIWLRFVVLIVLCSTMSGIVVGRVDAASTTPPTFTLPTGRDLVSGWTYLDPRLPADGPQHNGIDYACLIGEPIYATADGYVFWRGWHGDCGNEVGIQHQNGCTSHYCHLSSFAAQGWVHRRDVIGYCGDTGLSTGPHVHFEVNVNGMPIDPTTIGRADLRPPRPPIVSETRHGHLYHHFE